MKMKISVTAGEFLRSNTWDKVGEIQEEIQKEKIQKKYRKKKKTKTGRETKE